VKSNRGDSSDDGKSSDEGKSSDDGGYQFVFSAPNLYLQDDTYNAFVKVDKTEYFMIKPMMGHRRQPKKFNPPLRYYNPEEEEKRRRRIRIKTRSASTSNRRKSQNMRVLVYAVGLMLVIYVMSIL
jgi:hypothetical protein